jgi:phytanoyl-CoA hydroxylase
MANSLRERFDRDGFVLLRDFFPSNNVARIREDAKSVFARQMVKSSILRERDVEECVFERALFRYFGEDAEGFINCGKTIQHLISLHRFSLGDAIMSELQLLGIRTPNVCTRPVLFFNSKHLAKSEVYHKSPPHQDWRSMQGSLNAIVVWVPLADVPAELGALEVVPGSHVWGLLQSQEDDWYRRIEGVPDDQYQSVEVKAGDALFFSAFLLHRSGNNVTDSIRWSCHFRYNDLDEPTFIRRKYPNPYVYKPQQELITEGFPTLEDLHRQFPGAPQRTPARV